MSDVVGSDGSRWRRVLLRTPWLSAEDDLGAVLVTALDDVPGGLMPGDLVAVAEKVAIVTSGRSVPVEAVRPTALARVLAATVRPVGESRGLSLPHKMQYVLDVCGWPLVLWAALVAALTRPVGVGGVFYRSLGSVARDLDGLRGAYRSTLLPPLTPSEAQLLSHHLTVRAGCPVAIVDINDRGGSIRFAPRSGPDPATLLEVLADNPHGDCDQSTPVVLLRPLSAVAVPRARTSAG